MTKNRLWPFMFSLAFLLTLVPTSAQQLKLPLSEVAQNSHLIFMGTVDRKESRFNPQRTMIFTDVYFKEINVVSATGASVQRQSATVRLTHAGGDVDGYGIDVSDMPKLLVGRRYLIFMSDDGVTYGNPIIGGSQGLFEVIKDSVSDREYLLSAGGKAVTGATGKSVSLSSRQVARIESGVIVPEARVASPADSSSHAPTAAAPADSASTLANAATESGEQPLRLKEFIILIKTIAQEKPEEQGSFKKNTEGVFYKRVNGQMEAQPIEIQTAQPQIPFNSEEMFQKSSSEDVGSTSERSQSSPLGGPLGACGYHTRPLVMEQVPVSFWSYPIVNDNMYTWNVFMDLFRYTASDGFFGNNSQNEFGAFASDATLFSVYGFHWNGSLAVNITFRGFQQPQCGRIVQSDVIWNNAYNWTSDATFAIGNSNVVLLRSVNQHETGHSWGLQIGSWAETYDYDQPSVMHAYYSNIVEDGWGVHAPDAYLIRRHYDDQTGIIARKDVGVESYRAANGLINAGTNTSFYFPGNSITLSGITAENMSNTAVTDMRIRFYLSTNRVISTSDYQMGGYWFWTTFPAEAYNVANYTTTIPLGIPAGTYYVGAIISVNGFGSDDYPFNNSTSLYFPITIGASQGLPNLKPFQPFGWSDEVVVSASTGTNIDATQITPNDLLYVDWAVINQGNAATASTFFTKLYVDGIERASWFTSPPLGVNFYGYVQDYSIGKLTAGTHTIRIVADTGFAVAESNEIDNQYTKTITVTSPQTCFSLTTNVSPANSGSITRNVAPNCSGALGAPATEVSEISAQQAPSETSLGSIYGPARDKGTEETFDSLMMKTETTGTVRVIVGMDVPFQAEGMLATTDQVSTQRSSIAEAQDTLIAKLPTVNTESVKKFPFIPYMAMEVDSNALRVLEASSEINSIQEDRLVEPTLAQSVSLVGAPAAWTSGYSGAGRAVAILDTGVDKTHPFLSGKVVSEACYSTNGANSSSVCPGSVPQSTSAGSGVNCSSLVNGCSHGTHVAGIAAGKSATFSGVAKDASVIAIQVFSRFNNPSDCGSSGAPCVLAYTSDIILGLQRVQALNGSFSIAAANMSLGGGRFFSNCDASEGATKTAIDNLRSLGIATVISSGNNGYSDSLGSPACISTAISVGSTGDGSGGIIANSISSFSNSSSFLSLLAPGQVINSSVPGGGFANFQGTSMAAPHVTGAWAVLKSKAPTATVPQVLAALTSTGLPITDTRNNITKPRIRVDSAVNSLGGASGGQYASGTVVTLTPVAGAGYTFQSWTGCPSVSGNNCIVAMTAARSVTANFAPGGGGGGGVNFALAANGGVATASSTYGAGFSPIATNNGDRRGLHWGSTPATGSGWADATPGAFPDWLQIAFNGTKTISEINVFTIQDAYGSPVEPTDTMTFGSYGITSFEVQYWTGAAWLTVPGGNVTGNNKVKRRFTFAPIATQRIRVLVHGGLGGYSRIIEVEAFGSTAPTGTNVARSANGGVASASSSYGAAFLPLATNNGDRRGLHWGSIPSTGSGWADATGGAFPDWVQIDFNGTKTIHEIDVYTIQDAYGSPVEPTDAMTFAAYGITAFEVQYWTGAAWITVPGGNVIGNNKVKRRFTFSPIATQRIRVLVHAGLGGYSRIIEVEAYQN